MKMDNPLTLVIFGATGDLYQNKLSLALFNLFSSDRLPSEFTIIGFARRPLSDSEFQNLTRDSILKKDKSKKKEDIQQFLTHVRYIQGDLENLEHFKNLHKELMQSDEKKGSCTNKLFYLATPPSLYGRIFNNISEAGLTVTCAPGLENKPARNASSIADAGGNIAWTRVLVEKPFGQDLFEAEKLDKLLGNLFDESQIFRIDHYLSYLAKGVVEKILDFRFGSDQPKESNEDIKNVRIIFHETDVVGKRGPFYDSLGAFRDVGQSHMLQMLALVAMENPAEKKNGGIHSARQKVLEKTKLLEKYPITRGQYEGYLGEPGIKSGSTTETFFRLTFFVDNPEWKDIPITLEFGKALNESQVFIEICFKKSKTCINFPVSDEHTLRDAYEKVFYDCLLGDQTIFISTGEVIAQWKLATDIIQKWQSVPLVIYKKGTKAEDIK